MKTPVVEVIARLKGGEVVGRWPLALGEYKLGASEQCDLSIKERGVSREHARIIVRQKEVLIEDLGSRFGTRRGGEPIKGRVRLSEFRPVQIGDLRLEAKVIEKKVGSELPAATLKDAPVLAELPAREAKENLPSAEKPPNPPEPPAKSEEPVVAQTGYGWPLLFLATLVAVAVGVVHLHKQWEQAEERVVFERSRAESERIRADRAGEAIRRAAPVLVDQARVARDAGRFEEALALVDSALGLNPEPADFHLLRAHLLQSQLQLARAVDEYRAVLIRAPDHGEAAENLALCQRLLAENEGAASLRADLQQQLVEALQFQRREVEATPLAAALGSPEAAERILQARLESLRRLPGWNSTRLRRLAEKSYALDLSELSGLDFTILRGLPITELNLTRGDLAQLPDLRGLPLRRLVLTGTRVAELGALRGLPLEELVIDGTPVADLSPLHDLPLRELSLRETPVRDITPLGGLPLRSLDVRDHSGLPDYRPLLACRRLEILYVPVDADIECLRDHPALKLIAIRTPESAKPGAVDGPLPASAFWRKYGDLMRQRAQTRPAPSSPPPPSSQPAQ